MLVRVILHLNRDLINLRRNLQDDIILIHNFLYLHLWSFVLKLDQGVELFILSSILIVGLWLKLLKLSLVLGRIVGGCVHLSSIDNRLLFLDDPLVGSLLSLLRDTLGKIEFVLVGQKTSIITIWWLVLTSCGDIKWLECSVDDLSSWLSRIVILGLSVRIVANVIFYLFLTLTLQAHYIWRHHGIWMWNYRNTAVIIVLGLLKQTEKRPFILLQFFKLVQFSFHATEILIDEIINVLDLQSLLFQL